MEREVMRLLTPGTSTACPETAGRVVNVNGAVTLRESHYGFYATSSELWAGYFPTERMCRLAVAMVQAVAAATTKEG